MHDKYESTLKGSKKSNISQSNLKKKVFKCIETYHIKIQFPVPPNSPRIFNEKMIELNNVAGPYQEGDDMKLRCIVEGGRKLYVL